jgi:S-DNA-T family DNA segregation ATPase FtsK/SpoIIIE
MSDKRHEIIGLLLIAIGILVFLSLFSYDPAEEPTISKNVVIHNWMGIVGVFVSHWLFKYTIGAVSFVIPILIILWGWWFFAKRNFRALARFTIYVLVLSLAVSAALALPSIGEGIRSSIGFKYSGLVGGVIAKTLNDFFGYVGSIIIVALIALIAIRGYFSWNFYGPFERLFHRKHFKERKLKTRGMIGEEGKEFKGIYKVSGKDEESLSALLDDMDRPIEPPQPIPAEGKKAKKVNSSMYPVQEIKSKTLSERELEYQLPDINLLNSPPSRVEEVTKEEMRENAQLLEESLRTFGVEGRVVNVSPGPVITRYEIEPASGVRVSKIVSLSDDLARILEAKRIRIIAPIPGKSVVGVEIPNLNPSLVYLKSIASSRDFVESPSKLAVALAKTTSGEPYVLDLEKMPHLLIAGATGSGKSVCVNTIIASILFRSRPDEVKFVLIDPKKIELSIYKDLVGYHLITSEDLNEYVVTRTENAIIALRSVEVEMERRYEILASASVRNISEFNAKVNRGETDREYMPYIVVVIDELSDLILTSAREIEEPITRLAQMSRAVGIHLVIATQRPSVDVITGIIKANFPARIAFQVASKFDSRTILDANGAEKLLGRGDLLITTSLNPEPVRLHNAFISIDEIDRIISHIRRQPKTEEIELPSVHEEMEESGELVSGERDELFYDALRLVVTHQQGSISLLQRRLKVGYARAARLIDQLEAAGIVGPFTGSKAREVLVDESYLEDMDSGSIYLDDK